MTIKISGALALCGFVVFPNLSMSQDMGFGLEIGASSLGVYVAPRVPVLDNKLSLRTPLYFGTYSNTYTVEGNSMLGKLETTSAAVMADYQPWGNGLRLSGGMGLGGYRWDGTVVNPVFEGNSYTGTSKVTFKQKDVVQPIISFGYAKQFKNGFGLVADIGAKFGKYEVSATSDFLTGAAKAQYESDVQAANKSLTNMGMTPFITLGGAFRF